MKEYRFSEGNAIKAGKSIVYSRIPIFIMALAASIFLADWNQNGRISGNMQMLLIIVPVMIVIVTIGIYIGYKALKKNLLSSAYRVSESAIEYDAPSEKTIKINFEEVTKYRESKQGLLIRSAKKRIFIFSGVDGYEELSVLIISRLK